MLSTMGGGGPWFEKTVVPPVRIRLQRREEHVLETGEIGLADPAPGALRDDRLEGRRLRGGFEQDLAADRGAETADAVGIDIRPALEILGACDQVAVAGPANGVALAPALSARVEQQHAVPVAREHPRLLHGRAPGKDDERHGSRGDVRRGQLEPVTRVTVTVSYGTPRSGGRPGCGRRACSRR